MGRNNNASYNIGAYKSSDAAKADFTRLANHLLDGKRYFTFVPALETSPAILVLEPNLELPLVVMEPSVAPEAILVQASPAPKPF